MRGGRKLYWAYGSNLCVRNMKRRCPAAKKASPLIVEGGVLTFRGVADVVLQEGSSVPGGLWWITPECEATLDRYEGVNSRLYLKRYLDATVNGKKQPILFYQMATSRGVLPPSEEYAATILEGYRDFGLDTSALEAAIARSWEEKSPTNFLRQRHQKRGSPRLARGLPAQVVDLKEQKLKQWDVEKQRWDVEKQRYVSAGPTKEATRKAAKAAAQASPAAKGKKFAGIREMTESERDLFAVSGIEVSSEADVDREARRGTPKKAAPVDPQHQLKRPCKHCPFAPTDTRIKFACRERAEEIAESAYRNGFPCHESAECVEDGDGEEGFVFGPKTQHCAGASMMFLADSCGTWPGIGNDEDRAERLLDQLDWDAPHYKSEEDFIDANDRGSV